MMDLQMGFPRFPLPNPITDEQAVVRRLGFFEALFKRATEYSVVLTALDTVAWPRDFLARKLPFPVEAKKAADAKGAAPPPAVAGQKAFTQAVAWLEAKTAAIFEPLKARDAGGSAKMAPSPVASRPAKPETAAEYEERRERELGAVVSAMAAFAKQMGLQLYFVTPYGPYFRASDAEMAKYSLNMMGPATPLYGGLAQATRRELELQTRVISKYARAGGARVIEMGDASREATTASGDFSTDGIHFSAQGFRKVGGLIAERLRGDGLCAAGAR
jgi:hypothetical protein